MTIPIYYTNHHFSSSRLISCSTNSYKLYNAIEAIVTKINAQIAIIVFIPVVSTQYQGYIVLDFAVG